MLQALVRAGSRCRAKLQGEAEQRHHLSMQVCMTACTHYSFLVFSGKPRQEAEKDKAKRNPLIDLMIWEDQTLCAPHAEEAPPDLLQRLERLQSILDHCFPINQQRNVQEDSKVSALDACLTHRQALLLAAQAPKKLYPGSTRAEREAHHLHGQPLPVQQVLIIFSCIVILMT